jgi:hypothetical protein
MENFLGIIKQEILTLVVNHKMHSSTWALKNLPLCAIKIHLLQKVIFNSASKCEKDEEETFWVVLFIKVIFQVMFMTFKGELPGAFMDIFQKFLLKSFVSTL